MSSTKQHLIHLETVGLIKLAQTHPELEFLFRHSLVQEVAYNSLLIEDRKKLHRQVGEAIEEIYPDQLEEFAAVLGNHFEIAGDDQRALKYFTLAGDVNFGIYANAEAVNHYTRALKVAKRSKPDIEQLTHLYTQCGRALELSAKFDQALDNYKEMGTLAQARDDKTMKLVSLMAQATIHATANFAAVPTKGQTLLEQARILANELGDQASEAKILWNLLLLNTMFSGDLAERIEYGEQGLALARKLDLREQTAFILHDLWYCYASVDHWARLTTILDEGRELWRELGNQPMLAENLTRTYLVHLVLGDYEQAITYSNQAFHLGQTSNNIDQQVLSRSMIGFAYLEQGQPDKAITVMAEAVALGETIGNVTALSGTQANLGWTYGLLGAVDRGLAIADGAQAAAKEKFPLLRPWALVAVVRLHILKQNLIEAETILAEVGHSHDLKQTLGFIPFIWIETALAEGELALAKQDFDRVVTVMEDLLGDLHNTGTRYLYPDAFYLKSLALLGLGQTEKAHKTLLQARTKAEALGSRRALWPILMSLSDIEQQLGHKSEAETLRQQVRKIVEYIANHINEDALRRSFLNLPDVRTVLDNKM